MRERVKDDAADKFTMLTRRIRTGINGMEQLHITDVVNEDLFFENDDQSTSIHFNRENGSWKGEFTYSGLSL
jgi:hypothetical protein